MTDKFCLKIEVMADKPRLRYSQSFSGSTMDMISLPCRKQEPAMLITCTHFPGDTRTEIDRHEAAECIRQWKRQALEVILVDHRKAIEEVCLPSGMVLTRQSHLLLLVKAFQQWQRSEMILAEDDAQAIKIWIGDRVPFGMEAIDGIKDMTALNGLDDV